MFRHLTLMFALIGLLPESAFAERQLRGTWNGSSYNIRLSDSFGYVRGEWGDVDYDLKVDGTFGFVRGEVGDSAVDLVWLKTFLTMRGSTPCGAVDLTVNESFGQIRGTVCGSAVDLRNIDRSVLADTLVDVALDVVAFDFPAPARRTILHFIAVQLNKN